MSPVWTIGAEDAEHYTAHTIRKPAVTCAIPGDQGARGHAAPGNLWGVPVNVVLVPGAPVCVPELSGRAFVEVEPLVETATAALRRAAAGGGEIIVLTTGPRPMRVPAGRYDLRRFGIPVPVGSGNDPCVQPAVAEQLPPEVLIGWWWLRRAEMEQLRETVVIQQDSDHQAAGTGGGTELHEAIARLGDAGTVVVVADGPCALHPKAPIPLRPSAVSLDRALQAFLDDGQALICPDRAVSRADGWYSRPLWEQLADAVGKHPAGDCAHGAPFGVGYHVARWELGPTTDVRWADRVPAAGNGDTTPVVIVGPTGSGKSDLALDLAEECGGEIVNLDAMQMYRGMDIGTAKVPADERRGIAHHLFDVLEITDTASVADYQTAAIETVEQIMARGRRPIIVGGSMMYFQSLVDDWAFPATDPQVRAKYEARLAEIGVEALHGELAAVDPEAGASILPTDPRRTVRALEVIELTGKPFAASRPVIGTPRWGARLLGLQLDLAVLDNRLDQRTQAMFDAGLLAEVRELERRGLRDGVTASRAIGYAQVLDAIDACDGADPEGEALVDVVEQVFIATRRYVRRQRSWFRRDPRITWLDATPGADPGLLEQARAALALPPVVGGAR